VTDTQTNGAGQGRIVENAQVLGRDRPRVWVMNRQRSVLCRPQLVLERLQLFVNGRLLAPTRQQSLQPGMDPPRCFHTSPVPLLVCRLFSAPPAGIATRVGTHTLFYATLWNS